MGRLLTRMRSGDITPADLPNLALWLDGMDYNTLTFNSGDISQWNDKSGNANHATQGVAAAQPLYVSTGLSGRPTLDFDTSQSLTIADSSSLNYTTMSYFMVLQRQTDTGGVQVAMNRYGAQREFQIAVVANDLFQLQASSNGSTTTHSVDSSVTATTGGAHLVHCCYDGSDIILSVDNEPPVATSMSGIFNSNTDITIGRATGANFMGRISEIIMYTQVLSTSQSNKITRYLAQKWGVTTL